MSRTSSALAALLSAVVIVAVAGCGVAPPAVGPTPRPTVPIGPPTATPTPTESGAAFTMDIFIDARSVTPLRKSVALTRGRTVMLLLHSDHDATVTITGAGFDKSVFVARLSTITSTFVVDEAGLVTIKSTDPVATIAEMMVL